MVVPFAFVSYALDIRLTFLFVVVVDLLSNEKNTYQNKDEIFL